MGIKIVCHNVSKNFSNQKIISGFNKSFHSNQTYAVLGANGVGKSTLLKMIAGYLNPSSGSIDYLNDDIILPAESQFAYMSFSAPYMELIEEFTLKEMIDFHLKFKSFRSSFSEPDIPQVLLNTRTLQKPINTFSSGMKQRLKLVLSIFSDTPVLLLDEPTTNLDAEGVTWYQRMIEKYILGNDTLLIVASNVESDYYFCQNRIQIGN